jgi:sugar (pentulose or hexulose) kinase
MQDCIAIFDIGKTNKKLLLFNSQHEIIHEIQTEFDQIEDEDGEPCENLKELSDWLIRSWKALESDKRFNIIALNFTTYGASIVHLDVDGKPITPLYNYLKKFPEETEAQFYAHHGNAIDIATETASPVLGMLNSGLQLYWLKYKHPILFNKVNTSLHLPQYCSWLFTGVKTSEFTSIGCHTALWNMQTNSYHHWVLEEKIDTLLPSVSTSPIAGSTLFRGSSIAVGTGLHDSSAALIPYLKKFKDNFILLSTGTWCIALNPFAKKNLSKEELNQDCLNYLTFQGNKVKASRLFLGNAHEVTTKRLAAHFFKNRDEFKTIVFDKDILVKAISKPALLADFYENESKEQFHNQHIDHYESYEEAYHRLIFDMVEMQVKSLKLASENQIEGKSIFVDGGFSRNKIFMCLLQQKLPLSEVKAFELSQGTALGAAMMMQE